MKSKEKDERQRETSIRVCNSRENLGMGANSRSWPGCISGILEIGTWASFLTWNVSNLVSVPELQTVSDSKGVKLNL